MSRHPLLEQLYAAPYAGYAYSYPHKTAYRALEPTVSLADAWAKEDKNALFLYLHIPFCEMRCGFCNLFTVANPKADLRVPYLDALARQIKATKNALGEFRFSRLSIGGGTPTFLDLADLERMFKFLRVDLGMNLDEIPSAIEVSPGTVDREKLRLLKAVGVDRVSMGVQSFHAEIAQAMGRPVKGDVVLQALDLLAEADFPRLNLDLIYGGAGQSREKWAESLQKAVDFGPQEIFLYPLYVRPLTGLDKTAGEWDDMRLALYQQGRDFLLENGYAQVSMRMFRKPASVFQDAPIYHCQEDGMVGLGVGARSYTRNLHYSSAYSVGRKGLKNIISGYNSSSELDFSRINHGVYLQEEEEKRRYLIKSLLHAEGLNAGAYRAWFGGDVCSDFPELDMLMGCGLVVEFKAGFWRLTAEGMMLSDALGPWLYSVAVKSGMEAYKWS
ncbi:MAG TPA: coproporphyrinogen III oxidase family protein [Bacteroidetes bacterium]|nr:coproporphyrinogen III oxidase family protein [Bacteroidota bacterium]